MAIVLGLDSSTQSLSAVVLDTDGGLVLLEQSVHFGIDLPQYGAPNGFIPDGRSGEVHADPMIWLDALDKLLAGIVAEGFALEQIEAVSGSGQQHGSVYLDGRFPNRLARLNAEDSLAKQIRPSLTRRTSPIWMDSSTSCECREIEEALGGPLEICQRSGSVAIERFTGPQIRRFFKIEPEAYGNTRHIHLVSSFLSSVLAGKNSPIDLGDGAGMNLMNLAAFAWDDALLEATAADLKQKLPPLVASDNVIAKIARYFVKKYGFSENCECVAWSGDNPAVSSAWAQPRQARLLSAWAQVIRSSPRCPKPLTDPNGYGHVFGNPWGGYMSLVCFRNGSLAREALRDKLRVDWDDFEHAATDEHLTDGVMLPFVESEITPRTSATGFVYSSEQELTALQRVRLLLEGQFLNMRLQSQWMNLQTDEILVTGGASSNPGVCQVIADVFGATVKRLTPPGSAAVGAAMRAAQAACGVENRQLQTSFCVADSRRALEPRSQLASAYAGKLVQFELLLESRRRRDA